MKNLKTAELLVDFATADEAVVSVEWQNYYCSAHSAAASFQKVLRRICLDNHVIATVREEEVFLIKRCKIGNFNIAKYDRRKKR